MMTRLLMLIGVAIAMFCHASPARAATAVVDQIAFGDAASEASHDFSTDRSEVVTGGLSQLARQLLPLEPVSWDGGRVSFVMKVDPTKPNYFTIKLWGDDAGLDRGRLLLFCEGKQVGQRHLGDVDSLDILSESPRFPGRFVYTTTVLPKSMTTGKESVRLDVCSLGRIWGYGETWDKFQKNMEQPSRGIYRAYTHTDPYFAPAADEQQGEAKASPPTRTQPGPEVLDAIKDRVNREVSKLLAADQLNQMQMQLLAKAYHVAWTPAYHNEATVKRLVASLDAIYVQYKADPKLAESDPKTWNPSWFGLGPSGDVLRRLSTQVTPYLDEKIAGADVTRRAGYSQMLVACRDWHRQNRRLYTNQSMINDLYGIYLANRGVAVVDPTKALSEPDVKRYLYESVGLRPWLGSDLPDGGSTKPVGDNYMQLTDKGLTKELGYVGSYGEVLDWATAIYDATRPTLDAEGDAKIKAQLVKIAKARGTFRHPLVDADGFRAMVLESVVGWRDSHFPGDVTYAQRVTRDAGPLETAVATLDPTIVGYAQQMLDDNQFFASMVSAMKETSFRVTAGLIDTPDAYERIKRQPTSAARMPMAPGQPDFVFSDEEDGVVAIKHGDDILYASLYWRARFGVNSLARVHHLTPTIERDATVWEDVQFDDSGMTFTRDGRVIEAQSSRHEKSKGDVQQAFEGEVQPIAKIPDGLKFKPGQESVYAGKGTFYQLRYGPYLIGMNMTTNRTFELKRPDGVAEADELVSKKRLSLPEPLKVGPRSTVVLWLGEAK